MTAGRRPLRQPRVGELVASELRDRILAGEFEAGLLATQDRLLSEFGVSAASIREALRILETEGLISVQRGNVGGAVVHRPGPDRVAYTLGLVLQAMGVTVAEVREGLERLEPACVAACAGRADRELTVVPALRSRLDTAAAAITDPEKYMKLSREFHSEIVQRCGNPTMIVMVAALEALWTAQVAELAFGGDDLGSFGDPEVRAASRREHELLLRHIAKGRSAPAEALARAHFSERRWRYAFPTDQVVRAARLASWHGGGG